MNLAEHSLQRTPIAFLQAGGQIRPVASEETLMALVFEWFAQSARVMG